MPQMRCQYLYSFSSSDKTVTLFYDILGYTLKSDSEELSTKLNLAISRGAVPILTSYKNMWYRLFYMSQDLFFSSDFDKPP